MFGSIHEECGVFGIFESLGANDLKLICEEVSKLAEAEKTAFAALIFSVSNEGTDYRMACSNGFKLSMKELCAAVNAAVRAPRGMERAFFARELEKRLAQNMLHGDAVRLDLPADVRASVVFDY